MFFIDAANTQITHLIRNIGPRYQFCQLPIRPQRLRCIKVDAVFVLIRGTFGGIEFETYVAI
jgi:hypothetical protein